MKLATSLKFDLPVLYIIHNRSEIKDIPIGVPFILGDEIIEKDIIRMMEYEILYQNAIRTGYPFNFKRILQDNGFIDILDYGWEHVDYMDIRHTDLLYNNKFEISPIKKDINKTEIGTEFKKYIRDSSCYVDIKVLKNLKVFPVWFEDISTAVSQNINTFAVYDTNMYNKKLGGMYGGIKLESPDRNLIIIDISSSIPRAISSSMLMLSKNMAESFYADILITGSKSTLYLYEDLADLNVTQIYDTNGMGNDQCYFRALVESTEKKYNCLICIGDNHTPSYRWSNEYNRDACNITREDGKKLCKWSINKLISLHTAGSVETAGYADWFTVTDVTRIKNWVKYLN